MRLPWIGISPACVFVRGRMITCAWEVAKFGNQYSLSTTKLYPKLLNVRWFYEPEDAYFMGLDGEHWQLSLPHRMTTQEMRHYVLTDAEDRLLTPMELMTLSFQSGVKMAFLEAVQAEIEAGRVKATKHVCDTRPSLVLDGENMCLIP